MARLPSIVVLGLLFVAPLVALAPGAAATHEEPDVAQTVFAELHDALGGAGRSGAAVVWTGEVAYVFGGLSGDGTGVVDDVVSYDPLTGEVEVIETDLAGEGSEALPARYAWRGVWDAENERIVLFGGVELCDGPCARDDAIAFDPATGEWEYLVEDEQPYVAWRGIATLGRTVYLFGGCDIANIACTNEVRAFDLDAAEPAFVTLEDVMPFQGNRMLAVDDGEIIYLIGGFNGTTQTKRAAIESFDPTGGFSTLEAALPTPTADMAGFVANGDAFILGGAQARDETVSTVYRWDLGADLVDTLDSLLPTPVSNANAFYAGPYAYLVGGQYWPLQAGDGGDNTVDDVVQILPAPVAIGAKASGARIYLETLGQIDDTGSGEGFTAFVNGLEIPIVASGADDDGFFVTLLAGVGSDDVIALSFDDDGVEAPADADGNALRPFDGLVVDVDSDTVPVPRLWPAAFWDAASEALVVVGGIDAQCSLDYGYCEEKGLTTALRYDPATGRSLTVGAFETGPIVASVPADGGIYLLSSGMRLQGEVSVPRTTLLFYDASGDAAWVLGDVPLDGTIEGASLVHDGASSLYLLGGIVCDDGCATLDHVWRLDATPTDEGSLEPTLLVLELPEPRAYAASAWLVSEACPDGCAYLLGGIDAEENVLGDVVRVDIDGAVAEPLSMEIEPRAEATAFVLDGTILLVGGDDGSYGLAEVTRVVLDEARNYPMGELAQGRLSAGYAFDGERVFAVGGTDDVDFVEIADIDLLSLDVEPPTVDIDGPALIRSAEETTAATLTFTFDEPMDCDSVDAALTSALADGWIAEWTAGDCVEDACEVECECYFCECQECFAIEEAPEQELVLTHEALPRGEHLVALDPLPRDVSGNALAGASSHEITLARPRSDNDDGPRRFVVVSDPAPEEPAPPVELANETAPETNETPVENVTTEEPLPPVPEPTPPDDGEPLEQTGTASGTSTDGPARDVDGNDDDTDPVETTPQTQGDAVDAPPAPAPRILLELPLSGEARGTIVISLEGVPDIELVTVVLVDADGAQTVLSRGIETTEWDTTGVPDGFYTILLLRDAPAPAPGTVSIMAGETTLASERVLVRNDIAPAVVAAGAAVAGVLAVAGVQAGLSAMSGSASGVMSQAGGGFDAFGFVQEVAGDAAEDKIRDKTKQREAALLERRRQMRSAVTGVVSLLLLAGLWALSDMGAWSVGDWLRALPVIGLAAVVVMALKYAAEGGLAYVTGAKARIRLLISGTIALAFSSIVLRNPFGYPGYVDEVGESEARTTWRMQGLRALAAIAGAVGFMLPFLAISTFAPWGFVSVGLLLAITNAATTAMPFAPLPGRDVWRWSKALAVAVALGCFGLYVAFAAGYAPLWALWTLGVAGTAAYAATMVHFRRTIRREKAVRVPVAVPVPVRTEEAPARMRVEDSEKRN